MLIIKTLVQQQIIFFSKRQRPFFLQTNEYDERFMIALFYINRSDVWFLISNIFVLILNKLIVYAF